MRPVASNAVTGGVESESAVVGQEPLRRRAVTRHTSHPDSDPMRETLKPARVRVGVDTGGTFTDFVYYAEGRARVF